jgi:two-component system CheB/CheR fusion protein
LEGKAVSANDVLEPSPGENLDAQPSFPVVGIGASAGGLEALTELLGQLSPQPGMAFLIAVHVDPHQKSHLPEILSKTTAMPVREASEGVAVRINEVYLIAPNTNMALTDGHLMLTPRSKAPGGHMPVDYLFRSLAAVRHGRAIGVVLSGGGTDGALGLQAIKSEGGITFAQDDKTARHPSMPRAAILDGTVDYVLRPRDIARELERIAQHPYSREAAPPVEPPPGTETFENVLALLRSRVGVDFSHYKQTTIKRRILRRMALRNLEDTAEYLQVLRDDPAEVQNLYQDFLIRVTQFFRDPEAFEVLKEKVFPSLLKNRLSGQPLRFWVAGCSTGEEAYSLAICLLEYLESQPETPSIKILATDLNDFALEKARAGVYLDNIEIDVSPERLRRFFIRQDGHYQISKSIRELCVFSRHNMANDPPFSRLNLVSCRNVLIYMDTPLQKRVLPILHYSLNPDGFLFLGASENIGSFGDLFGIVDFKHRLFVKKHSTNAPPMDFSTHVAPESHAAHLGRETGVGLWSALDVQREADRVLLTRYAPVGVVVDEAMTVLQFRGRTAPYLEPAPGMATLDLFRMLREGLLAEVRGAITQAKSENTEAVREGLCLLDDEQTRTIKVEVLPFKVAPSGVRFFLVLFQDAAAGEPPPRPTAASTAQPEQQVGQLQQEITALREYLQSVIEDQESTNEELKSANEEILSTNEELQSTNEELQTAKEEAQSANEELATVNEELRSRNSELARVNNDLVNLLSGVNIPIVTVSRDLRIRRFTPQAEKFFNLIPTDVGRPISDIKSNLNVEDLSGHIAAVIDSLTPVEREVQSKDKHWYSLRIRPYVTPESKIDGASIVLLDIDSIKRNMEQMKFSREP